ncbi:MAG: serine--tRNA ligase [Clostridiales bacterium]|jgi:seryl-tRNA synthetase|nr:serine--tRNA ligase [Clostridiales bacterium]
MLDMNLIREDPKKVADALAKRNCAVDFTGLLSWDKERRELIYDVEQLKAKRNKVSADIPRLKKQGDDVSGLMEEMKGTGDRIRASDERIGALETQITGFLAALPNMPADDVVAGDKENNEVVRVWGEAPVFSFPFKNHVDLVTALGLIDYERGVKLGGNGFWLYRGDGALLEWALVNYFIEEHIKDGYEFILPPHILTYQCGYTAGQFPKFDGDVFTLTQPEGRGEGAAFSQFILPTAETALVNVHRDEVLDEDELPKKYFAYTPCYRKEAGSARAEERGMIRGHQFNKVEMVQYTLPEDSDRALAELVGKAERLVRGLGLHYRVSKLAAEDCGASMAKTFDIEVWLPSMGIYKEVSSASNAMDYQARRGNIRFKRKATRKNELVHTLNASGLATSRIFPALVEQFQREDGSVPVPPVLQKWVGKEVLTSV